jgi:hypothetical protein
VPRNNRQKSEPEKTRVGRNIKIPVLPEEKEAIKKKADSAKMTVAAYGRACMLGKHIKSKADNILFEELSRRHGELNKLGNLLNQTLAKNVINITLLEKLIVDINTEKDKIRVIQSKLITGFKF